MKRCAHIVCCFAVVEVSGVAHFRCVCVCVCVCVWRADIYNKMLCFRHIRLKEANVLSDHLNLRSEQSTRHTPVCGSSVRPKSLSSSLASPKLPRVMFMMMVICIRMRCAWDSEKVVCLVQAKSSKWGARGPSDIFRKICDYRIKIKEESLCHICVTVKNWVSKISGKLNGL